MRAPQVPDRWLADCAFLLECATHSPAATSAEPLTLTPPAGPPATAARTAARVGVSALAQNW
jgi:hypothetical protein